MFRLNSMRKHDAFVQAVILKGTVKGDFLHIRDGDFYDVARQHNIEHIEAKKIATGHSKLVIATKMAAGFATTMVNTAVATAHGKPAICTPEQRQARVTTCAGDPERNIQPCTFFIQSEQRCSECGCPKKSRLLDKWDFVQSVCPKHKWPVL